MEFFFFMHVTFTVYLILLELVTFLIFIKPYKSLFISLSPHVSYSLPSPSFRLSLMKPKINKQLQCPSLVQAVALLSATTPSRNSHCIHYSLTQDIHNMQAFRYFKCETWSTFPLELMCGSADIWKS